MTQKKVVEIFNNDGSVSQYLPLSQRIEAFLQAYPPKEGFQVMVTPCDPLALKPGYGEVLQKAVEHGQDVTSVLNSPAAAGVVFRASLMDPEGRILATASSYKMKLAQPKDWEMGETAARQRLLAALGFGGDVLDEDENGDMASRGLNFQVKSATTPAPPAPAAPVAEATPAPVAEQEQDRPQAPAPVEEPQAQAPVETSKPTPPAPAIPAALVRQLEHQCRIKGRPVPEYRDADDLKAKLKEVMAA